MGSKYCTMLICLLSCAVVVASVSISILLTVVFPLRIFDHKYEYSRDVGSQNNESITDDFDGWPSRMQLSQSIFGCDVPNPNFDVSDEQLTEAWRVPPKSRLSPLMREIGRCKLASKWLRVNSGVLFEDGKCYCISAWWVIITATTSMASLFFHCCCGGYYGSCPTPTEDDYSEFAVEEHRCGRTASLTWSLLWYLAAGTYGLRHADAGLSYAAYGDMFPRAYYAKEPFKWFVVFILCVVNCAIEGIKSIVFSVIIKKAKKPAVAASVSSSPPSYESVRFAKGSKSRCV